MKGTYKKFHFIKAGIDSRIKNLLWNFSSQFRCWTIVLGTSELAVASNFLTVGTPTVSSLLLGVFSDHLMGEPHLTPCEDGSINLCPFISLDV